MTQSTSRVHTPQLIRGLGVHAALVLNPVPDGKALIATLMNPADIISGKPPAFGGPIVLVSPYSVTRTEIHLHHFCQLLASPSTCDRAFRRCVSEFCWQAVQFFAKRPIRGFGMHSAMVSTNGLSEPSEARENRHAFHAIGFDRKFSTETIAN